MTSRILILGGTTEAYGLADALATTPTLSVMTSLAGRTANPRLAAGETRIGGFGGVPGLTKYLRDEGIQAVVDATHPFASGMGWNAAEACRLEGVPLLRLERPAWVATPGDLWSPVNDWDAAIDALRETAAKRVFLAVGRQELTPFARLDDIWFLIRVVTPPDPMPPFRLSELLLSRGPFDLERERRLLDAQRIDTIVCKNSGGEATADKLVAARERGIRVIMRERPKRPQVPLARNVTETLAWIERTLRRR
ncbi:cobalt-precorrin-6A reductase [Thiorhodococcus mannitoliphagus]|uniref:Cobalt-precorrin-6A reductase n=1 Tax=Thiorhodococcus mannitoliphagus TaxID=329406 RepID=A0A6P1DSQ6_9GAMM|nr:cobalt-precorrin-6A reductase [Thiorhodococcus mannitoliphagus]NEX19971.1 cobalt-precorrin-6A reductase [Thiorhodococcus mannitoliphagus]